MDSTNGHKFFRTFFLIPVCVQRLALLLVPSGVAYNYQIGIFTGIGRSLKGNKPPSDGQHVDLIVEGP